jgi:hypothetical protein
MEDKKHTNHRGKIKNLKIKEESHTQLKDFCQENGLKMFAFVEKLIRENCQVIKSERNIYGD